MRALLAEDDASLREVIEEGLRENGYVLDVVDSGDDALHLLQIYDYTVVILDWMMDGLSGIEVVRAARRKQLAVPILMLTGRDAASDRVAGLDAGADDYLIKPFDFDELLARLRALQRRPAAAPQELALGRLRLDPAARRATVDGHPLRLTRTELAILEVLLRRVPGLASRHDIAGQVWEDESDPLGSNVIDVHVGRLRAKLRGHGVQVLTVRGEGFRLEVGAEL